MNPVRINGDERGFTLVEALVTLVMMVTIFFALHAVFEAGVRAVGVGEDESGAGVRARLAMERIEADLRAASPYREETQSEAQGEERVAGRDHLFFSYENPSEPLRPSASSGRITFGRDLDGRCGLMKPSGGGCTTEANPKELISYYRNDAGRLIRRSNNQYAALTDGVSRLEFTCLDGSGNPADTESEIRRVDITLTVRSGEAEQTLKSSVALRGRTG